MGGAWEARDPNEVKVENAVRQDGDSNPPMINSVLNGYTVVHAGIGVTLLTYLN